MPNLWIKPHAFAWILMALAGIALWGGCGKKGPPVPPRMPEMKAVTDLAASYENGVVVLAWHHPDSSAAVAGYAVFRFQHAQFPTDCQRCPLLFEKVAKVSLPPADAGARHKLTWYQSAASGFRYTYKVVPVLSSGFQGPDSNLAQVEVIP